MNWIEMAEQQIHTYTAQLEPEKEYTFSFSSNAPVGEPLEIWLNEISLIGKMTKGSVLFKTAKGPSPTSITLKTSGMDVEIEKAQIQIGDNLSDWSQAPEDYDDMSSGFFFLTAADESGIKRYSKRVPEKTSRLKTLVKNYGKEPIFVYFSGETPVTLEPGQVKEFAGITKDSVVSLVFEYTGKLEVIFEDFRIRPVGKKLIKRFFTKIPELIGVDTFLEDAEIVLDGGMILPNFGETHVDSIIIGGLYKLHVDPVTKELLTTRIK